MFAQDDPGFGCRIIDNEDEFASMKNVPSSGDGRRRSTFSTETKVRFLGDKRSVNVPRTMCVMRQGKWNVG